MPDSLRTPSYRHHKPSGQAVVTLNGKDIYLGAYGSKASRAEYDRLIAEWLGNGRRMPGHGGDLSIAELLVQFFQHVKTYYRKPDGSPTSEVKNYREVIRLLRKLYGQTPAVEFGPLALKATRQKMIEVGWCRTNINRQIGRVKHVFKWATENELVPPTVYHGLQAVAGLKAGRSDARESEPVQPVPEQHVEAIRHHISRQVWAMVELQLLTGMRPGEVCNLRGCDLDTSGKLWTYKPATHKTLHHGHKRVIYFGPRAQEVVRPFLKPNLSAHLFSPADAEAERREKMHATRTTPLSCGNVPGSNRARKPKKAPGEQYDVIAYCHAIAKACEVAFGMPDEYREPRGKKALEAEAKLSPDAQAKRQAWRRAKRAEWRAEHVWHPHQLRHTAATRLRKGYGLEAAQVILGHKTLAVTEVYAEKNVEAAKRIMGEVG